MSNRQNRLPDTRTDRQHSELGRHTSLASHNSVSSREEARSALRPNSRMEIGNHNSKKTEDAKTPDKVSNGSAINPKVFTALLHSTSNSALSIGSRGPEVVELKKLLNNTRNGLFQRKLDISSDVFDANTQAAVEKFQRNHSLSKDLKVLSKPGLTADGEAGKWTVTALLIKNGFEVPSDRKRNLIARLERNSGEHWSEPVPAETPAKRPDRSVVRTDLKVDLSQPEVNRTKFAQEHKSAISNERFPYQRYSNDCGPTACATAIGIVTGKNKEVLAAQFRKTQSNSNMSWENPEKFAEQAGVSCLQLSTSNPETIARYLKNGCTAVVSIKKGSPLTENGHITALKGVRGAGSSLEFENLDPNVRNLPHYSILPREQIQKEVRQVWVFGSKELLASLSGQRNYLASR